MIKPTDNIPNSNEYEQNQGNYIDQNEIHSHQFVDAANFRLDEYHKQPDSYNNYQIPPPKYQDIDQFVSNNLNKKDTQYNENLNIRPNEMINDPNQDEIISQIDDEGKQLDLYEKNKKRENNRINSNLPYKKSTKDDTKNYNKITDPNSRLSKYPHQMDENNMTDHQTYAYQQQYDANDPQEYDYNHQLRYREPNGDQIYSRRPTQPDLQIEYRAQQSPPIPYEIPPLPPLPPPPPPYYNDAYSEIPIKNSTTSAAPQSQQQRHYYNQQYRRYSDIHRSPSPSHSLSNQGQYRIYPQDDYAPIEASQDHLNPPYHSQRPSQYSQPPSYSKYSQYPPPPPPPSQHQFYSQQPFTPPPPQSRSIYSQNQPYRQPPYEQRQDYLRPPSQQACSPPPQQPYPSVRFHDDPEQDYISGSKLIYNHQPNIMLVDIPPSGKFARSNPNKLKQRFDCKIESAEIANFSPDASFQDDPINAMSSRSSSGSITEYTRQSSMPLSIQQQPSLTQQDPPILASKPSFTYQNNQYQQVQPQSNYSYYDHEYQQHDPYGYQSYPQDPNHPYNRESRRSPSPPPYYQPPPYSNNYHSSEYPPKSTNSYYSQYPSSQIPQISEQNPQGPPIPQPQISPIHSGTQYYDQPSPYQYPAEHQTMQTINLALNENENNNNSQSPVYAADSNSYSDYDEPPKNNQDPPYGLSTDDEDIREPNSNSPNREEYNRPNTEEYNRPTNDSAVNNSIINNTSNDINTNTNNDNAKTTIGNNTNTNITTTNADNNTNNNRTDNAKNNPESDQPAPRKRGRPRKNVDETSLSEPSLTEKLQIAIRNLKKNDINLNQDNYDPGKANNDIEHRITESLNSNGDKKNEDKDGLEILQKKKNKFKPQRFRLKMKDGGNPDEDTVIEETQGTFIKKGRGVFLRPLGFDEALADESLTINPHTLGFQPQNYWETVNREVSFGELVSTYFTSTEKVKMTKFVFKLYNMLLMTSHDDRFKELVGFNWYSDFVISINRLAASAMLNLSTTNYDIALPSLLDCCGFSEVTPENFALAHLSSYPGDEVKGLKLYYHQSSLFSKREMTTAELERIEVEKISKRGRKKTKYPAQS